MSRWSSKPVMPLAPALALASAPTFALVFAVALAMIVTGAGTTAQAGEFTRNYSLDADALYLYNLIGEVHLVATDGSDYEVEVNVRGEDADPDLIRIQVEEGKRTRVLVHFPVDEEHRYVYPKLGRHSKATITLDEDADTDRSWLAKIFKGISGKRIKVSGRGSGLELWVDVLVKVPRNGQAEVRLGVGEIAAEDIEGDLLLDISSGPIHASDIEGNLLADTGSGSVEVQRIAGEVSVDTGSGSVDVRDCAGEIITVDTGSGGVTVSGADCERFHIDTGSGGVRARGVKADRAKVDTGSGSVLLELDRMGSGKFVIDTGSGGIELILPPDASARITADTGSGSISADVPGVHLKSSDRDHVSFTVGDGEARVILDAGSGSIKVRQ